MTAARITTRCCAEGGQQFSIQIEQPHAAAEAAGRHQHHGQQGIRVSIDGPPQHSIACAACAANEHP